MSQLLVRNLEPALVKKLRHRASEQGVSVEEAHRRLLRSALLDNAVPPGRNFAEFLSRIPPSPDIDFDRVKDLPREIEF
ncbi:MAG: hypothetical protein SynsKO_00050 [Synoicihabitans sp.]